jgi:hypothetical protein
MANKPVKELSRRDALKLLGAAAGASVLANLPSKWSTPELTAGVLPAHAQTSALYSLSCDELFTTRGETLVINSVVRIFPADPGIQMHYVIDLTNLAIDVGLLTGDVATDGAGTATVSFGVNFVGGPATVMVTWSFVNPSDGTGSCFETLELSDSTD